MIPQARRKRKLRARKPARLPDGEENGEGDSSELSSGDSASVSRPQRRQRTCAIDDSDKD
ncbi:hypothetical protein PF005_g7396 [Phytophthora fragariae]|uniref:Uncharacterized protein n=1 Tax=Phytophthora fragariae TaxID=53985 RepID=A0A6A3U587_9STRA|nr:hypothetical protein PF003_g29947 [Phytophthora fragariae]KAE8942055.1 hypothetical protein PF009_g8176 [Phytophthora fragariae]KAE9018474.1 hypothetical protein PF011_g6242 [Phytophthora fragariae]KAE9121993.1 hypothetical protein PF007_g7614 [Phytophthora fragariae]KAE9122611.1 hypothetical protein PF010_g6689 [Phytophthora fragariae]